MTRYDALSLEEALTGGDVSRAWSVWSSAAEAALVLYLTGVLSWVEEPSWFVLLGWVTLKFVRYVRTLRIRRRAVMC